MFKRKSTRILVFIFCLLAFYLILANKKYTQLVPQKQATPNLPYITFSETKVFIEIADTPEEKTQGLSDRTSLPDNQGMLFVWDHDTMPGFWMKDMNFPIDIVWINDNKIVGIEKNALPEPGVELNQLRVYQPPGFIDAVLEVNAGFSDKHSLQVGDQLETSSF